VEHDVDPWPQAMHEAMGWVKTFNKYLEENLCAKARVALKQTWPAPEFYSAYGLPQDWNDPGSVETTCEAIRYCKLTPVGYGENGTNRESDLFHFVRANTMDDLRHSQVRAFVEGAIGPSVLANLSLLDARELPFIWQLVIDCILDNKKGQPRCEAVLYEVEERKRKSSFSLLGIRDLPSDADTLQDEQPLAIAGSTMEPVEPTSKRTKHSPRLSTDMHLAMSDEDEVNGEIEALEQEQVSSLVKESLCSIREMSRNLREESSLKFKMLTEIMEEDEDFRQGSMAFF